MVRPNGVSITSARSIVPQLTEDLRGLTVAPRLDVERGVGRGADLTVVGLTEQITLDSQDM
jgi:hypothetical protein